MILVRRCHITTYETRLTLGSVLLSNALCVFVRDHNVARRGEGGLLSPAGGRERGKGKKRSGLTFLTRRLKSFSRWQHVLGRWRGAAAVPRPGSPDTTKRSREGHEPPSRCCACVSSFSLPRRPDCTPPRIRSSC